MTENHAIPVFGPREKFVHPPKIMHSWVPKNFQLGHGLISY